MEKTSFKPNRRDFKPKGKMIYIGNLNYKVNQRELKDLFEKFGRVKHVNLLTNPGTDQSKGIAFVDMLKASEADNAIKGLDGRVIGGRTVKVSAALDNQEQAKKTNNSFVKKVRKDLSKEQILERKKVRNRRGLNELFENTGKK